MFERGLKGPWISSNDNERFERIERNAAACGEFGSCFAGPLPGLVRQDRQLAAVSPLYGGEQ